MVEKSHTGGFWPQLGDPYGTRLAEWVAPPSEAASNEAGYRIAIELPGVAEDDIHLSVEEGVVTVKGEKRTGREETGETWFFSERQYGSFQRSFRLPADADPAAVKATLKDGVLTVALPRKAPAAPAATRVRIDRG